MGAVFGGRGRQDQKSRVALLNIGERERNQGLDGIREASLMLKRFNHQLHRAAARRMSY